MDKLFIPASLKKSPAKAVERSLPLLEGHKRIGLITTAQHLKTIPEVGKFLEKQGKKVVLGGQVLGCRADNALRIEKEVDCFLFIGSGRFHPMWVSLKTEKKVVVANPYSDSADLVSEEEKKKYLKKRKGRILKALEANTWGIIVSTKDGQFAPEKAWRIKKKLESLGKEAFVFAGGEISPDNLLPFKVDAWVNTACPRLAEDHFTKPVLNPEEFDELEGIIGT